MWSKTACQGATSAGSSVGLVSASLLWATMIAFSPWLPATMGIADLTGVTVLLSMLLCGIVPSLLLGSLLGRARACWALATCTALGPTLWILDFTSFSDPDVHSSDSMAVAFVGGLAWGLSVPRSWGCDCGPVAQSSPRNSMRLGGDFATRVHSAGRGGREPGRR